MDRPAALLAFKSWLIVVALSFTGLLLAADAPKTRSAQPQQDLELGEILVEGRKPETKKKSLIAWLDRLVGQFSYEGYVERRGGDGAMDRAAVHGGTQCHRFGKQPAVQCLVNATWPELRGPNGVDIPGGVSSLTPAVAVYGLDPTERYIGLMQVDSKGVAASGQGWIFGDTLVARSPCADLPGNCQRVVRIEAQPDAKVIRMRVDLEQDGKLQVRYSFQWNRLPQTPVAAVPESIALMPATPERVAGRSGRVRVPLEVETWLRRMVGYFRIRPSMGCTRLNNSELNADVICPGDKADETDTIKDRPVDMECQSIGGGPGVRCALYIAWPESGIPAAKRAYMKLNPGYMLYGFDPVQRGIAVGEVSAVADIGPTVLSTGALREDRLTYVYCLRPPCGGSIMQLYIPKSGKWVRWRSRSTPTGGGLLQLTWEMKRVQAGALVKAPSPPTAPTNPSPRRP